MRVSLRISLAIVCLLVGSACSTAIGLTAAGTDVAHVTDADLPAGCRFLGGVTIGIPPDAARPSTEAELILLMRNRAGEEGAEAVIVESSAERRGVAGEVYWRGQGRSYNCPEGASSSAPAETSGGEGLESEGEGDAAGGEDESIDDLFE